MSSRRALALSSVLASGLAACGAQPGVCSTRDDPQLRADGGGFACVQADQCPLPSNTLYCPNDVLDQAKACVRCAVSVCVTSVPEACP